jgi:hypothetical protein
MGAPSIHRAACSRSALLLLLISLSPFAGKAADDAAGKQRNAPTNAPSNAQSRSPYHSDRFAGRAGKYYRLVWGIEEPTVRLTESGEVIRFSWTVLTPERARPLLDKGNEPSLIDPVAGVALAVPTLEKIGPLRQASVAPEAGKAYWLTFSNKGRPVKKGHKVDVVIGPFRAQGLVVD